MYLDYYGFTQAPFHIVSDPNIFFSSRSHREALSCLRYGVQERKGIMVLSGEVGTGKTTLCKTFLKMLPAHIKTSLVLNPYFNETQLVRAIAEDFGVIGGKTKLDVVNALNHFLLSVTAEGGNAVVIVDEAQNLNARQLEHVRLLSNLENSQGKLLQIILAGQPELEQKLAVHGLRQIRQRVSVKYRLKPLDLQETKEYIDFRLSSGAVPMVAITPQGYERIYEFSQGIPRLINILCDRTLLYGFAHQQRQFDCAHINECIEELR